MTYIKHWNKYYKEVDLASLTKKELIDLLKTAIEINPQIVERIRDYVKHEPRWGKETWLAQTNVAGKNQIMFTDTLDSNLNKLKVTQVLSLVKNI